MHVWEGETYETTVFYSHFRLLKDSIDSESI